MHYFYTYQPSTIVNRKRKSLDNLLSVSEAYKDSRMQSFSKAVVDVHQDIQDMEVDEDIHTHKGIEEHLRVMRDYLGDQYVQMRYDSRKRV